MNTVGMHSVVPMPLRRMNAGLEMSHAVYPRASKVVRNPPLGKLDASGSPCTSCLPENFSITSSAETISMNESCFSAVAPVMGWNQWL